MSPEPPADRDPSSPDPADNSESSGTPESSDSPETTEHAAPDRARLRANVPKILVLNSFWMFLIVMPVVVPLFGSHGLDMEQIFWLQSIFAGSIVCLEVPSGYLADLFGRRRSLILAGLFHGAAFTVLAFAESFAAFVVFELLAAFGNSLFSGSDVALLYDTEEALGERGQGTHTLGRKLLWAQVGETVAAPLGGLLALAGLKWPALVNAAVSWIPLFIACSLVEPPRTKATFAHRENFRRILGVIFRTTPLLRLTFLALVAYGLATLLAVWSFQGYWRSLDLSLGWFGVVWAAYNLTVALVGRAAHRLEGRFGAPRLILAIATLPIVGYGGMALCAVAGLPPALALIGGIFAGLAFQVGRGLNQVVVKGALNSRVPPELRATANSLSSLGVRIFFVLLGPAMGWGFDQRGYALTFSIVAGLFCALLLAVALPLVLEIRRDGSSTRDAPR